MRRTTGLLLLLTSIVPMFGATPPLLDEAIKKWMADENYWAYTQEVRQRDGKDVEVRVEEFDPSQPYDSQWRLVELNGKTPTKADEARWSRRKAREIRRRDRMPIANYFDFAKATVAEETEQTVRYAVPLRPEAYRRLPLDKFGVTVVVDKERHELEHFSAGLLDEFHLAFGLAKVTDADVDIAFQVIDGQYPSQPRTIHAAGAARIAFFFSRSGDVDVTWSHFRRVVPYDTHFVVEIGELRALNF